MKPVPRLLEVLKRRAAGHLWNEGSIDPRPSDGKMKVHWLLHLSSATTTTDIGASFWISSHHPGWSLVLQLERRLVRSDLPNMSSRRGGGGRSAVQATRPQNANEKLKRPTWFTVFCLLSIDRSTYAGCGLVQSGFSSASFYRLAHTMLHFGVLHSKFPFWNCTTQLYRAQLLCIWPPFTMWPLLREKSDLHRAGLWQWFRWRPALFDWFSPESFSISTVSSSLRLSLASRDERDVRRSWRPVFQSEFKPRQMRDFLILCCVRFSKLPL